EGGKVALAGAAARVFRKGLPPVDVEPGADLAGLLGGGPRVAYTVTATFTEAAVADEGLAWLCGGHPAQGIAAGGTSSGVVELDVQSGRTFEARYVFPSREVFERYVSEHAPRLREEGARLFPSERGVSLRRSHGVVVV